MLETIEQALNTAVGFVWAWPVVILCLGGGLVFTLVTKFIQFRAFGHAIKVVAGVYDKPGETGHITHAQALSAAVSGTVGLGNIAGVAVAISTGGPGAIFWMWMIGLVGMATKYAECGLGTHYRVKDEAGNVRGGAMYYITRGLPERWPQLAPIARPLGLFFAGCAAFASLGGGNMFQSNNVASVLNTYWSIPAWVTGGVLAVVTGLVIIGGIKRIGTVAGFIVPFMCGIYVLGALGICAFNPGLVIKALGIIFSDAFTGQAAAGGVLGTVIITGVRRAVFSSESGLGSAPMAHAAAKTDIPIRQGIVALLEPFIDTIVVCSATAIVIVMSGLYGTATSVSGVTLTTQAFDKFIPGFGSYFLALAVVLFAFSTAITWSYYGEVATEYLFGRKAILPYKILFVAAIFTGAIWSLGPVIAFSDLTMGLMVIPNMLAVLLLSGKVRELTDDYFKRLKAGEFDVSKSPEPVPAGTI